MERRKEVHRVPQILGLERGGNKGCHSYLPCYSQVEKSQVGNRLSPPQKAFFSFFCIVKEEGMELPFMN